MLLEIYRRLLESFGKQGWWPVRHGLRPPEWEIMVGAVLTQNTAWSNVEKALENLASSGILDRKAMNSVNSKKLAELIRPSGYFNQKARKLKTLASFRGNLERGTLLSLWGIGPETADSIMLYAFGKPYFVVDAYTKRIFSRLGLIEHTWSYEVVQEYFQGRLPKNPELYKEFHALIVELAKRHCRTNPLCNGCPMSRLCRYNRG